MQEGFDEGYMLGAELGMRGGWIIGILEAIVRGGKDVNKVKVLLREARKELSVKGLYAPEHFGQDGLWKYRVGEELEGQEEGELDFRKVAAAHPIIKRWTGIVETLAEEAGLDLGRLKDRETATGD